MAPALQDWKADLGRGIEPLDPAEVAPVPPEKKKGTGCSKQADALVAKSTKKPAVKKGKTR